MAVCALVFLEHTGVSLGRALWEEGIISQNDRRTGRHLSIRELSSLTHTLCSTGALAVAVVAVSDLG